MNWRADETYWIRQTYLYSWDVIQFIYQGSLLCTHCVRQQSPSTPDNAEVRPSAITSSRKSKRKATHHVVCSFCRHDATRQSKQAPRTLSHGTGRVIPIVIKYYFWGIPLNWLRALRLEPGHCLQHNGWRCGRACAEWYYSNCTRTVRHQDLSNEDIFEHRQSARMTTR